MWNVRGFETVRRQDFQELTNLNILLRKMFALSAQNNGLGKSDPSLKSEEQFTLSKTYF